MDTFSSKYFKYFNQRRNKNIKFDFIKEEKRKIKNKLKRVKYKILLYEIPKNKIEELVNTPWVYHEVINNLESLDTNYKITWYYKTTHNIYLKCCILLKYT